MVKISLTTYTITAHSKEQQKNVKLNNLNANTLYANNGKYNTFNEILSSFFKDTPYNQNNKYLSVKQINSENEKIYYGELNYGPYGTKHTVVNAAKNQQSDKVINPEDSVLTPYYFYIQLFENRTDALLILETKGNSGIKVVFEEWINNFLKKINCTHLKIKIEPFLPEKLLDKFATESHVRKIRYLSYKLPKDKTDILDEYEPNEGYAEYVIHIKKEKSKNHHRLLKKILKKEKYNSETLMRNIDIPVDDIKLELELDKTKRTFSIGNLSKTQPSTDITYILNTGEDGHRTFESIHNAGKTYAKEIISY